MSESTNNVLNGLTSATTSLTKFVLAFENTVSRWRSSEADEDFRCKQGAPQIFVSMRLKFIQVRSICKSACCFFLFKYIRYILYFKKKQRLWEFYAPIYCIVFKKKMFQSIPQKYIVEHWTKSIRDRRHKVCHAQRYVHIYFYFIIIFNISHVI